MNVQSVNVNDILNELLFSASRSSGPGGQNVNKVNTKITLKWDVARSQIINQEQKNFLLKKFSAGLTKDGVLILTAQDNRSQIKNKEKAISKLGKWLEAAFKPKKTRKATKPNKAAQKKRRENKQKHSEKKIWRRKP